MRASPAFIHTLAPNEVFVFGSNLQGIHGKGAAKQALKWGAKKFQGIGLAGQTYAIPTRDYHGMSKFTTLPIEEIATHVLNFIQFAKANPGKKFMVTPVGTGNAGYSHDQMFPLFKEAVDVENIYLPVDWVK